MVTRISAALILSASMLAATPATAGGTGLYAGVFAMGGVSDSGDVSQSPAVTAGAFSNDTDGVGWTGGAGVWAGYDLEEILGAGFRAELAASWRARHDENISYGAGAFVAKANLQTTDLMLSGLWDLPVEGWGLQPYLGAGAGIAYHDTDRDFLSSGGSTGAGSDSETGFAWQLQGGVTYPMGEGWALRADYRYIDYGSIGVAPLPTGDAFEFDLASHDLRLGAVWEF